MVEVVILAGNQEATRKFLAGIDESKKGECNLYFLLKETNVLDPDEQKFYRCDIEKVYVILALTAREYQFAFGLKTFPWKRDVIGGVEAAILGVNVSEAYITKSERDKARTTDGPIETLRVYFSPRVKTPIENARGFEFHYAEFCDYLRRSLEAAFDSDSSWNVPDREFALQVGELEEIKTKLSSKPK